MSLSATLHSYFTIIQKLQNNSHSTKAELMQLVQKKLETFREKDGKAEKGTSVRSFERDLKNIYNLFGLQIKYSRKKKGYYIAESVATQQRFLQQMAQSFDTLQLLNLGAGLQSIVLPEKTEHKGIEYFAEILYAIRERKQLQFTYHKFWDDDSTERTVAPYHLKEAGQRWYLIAKDTDGNQYIKHFALDRMTNLLQTNTTFAYPENNSYLDIYQYTFGIDSLQKDEHEPQDVVLSFDRYQGKYVKTIPLHPSQQTVVDDEKELRIKLRLYITRDLEMQILSYGNTVKVIEPHSLADSIAWELKATLKQYK